MNRTFLQISAVALCIAASAFASQPSYGSPPAAPPTAVSVTPARCGFGVHFKNFSTSAMSPQQFGELQDYLRNAKCAKRPAPAWLAQTTWSYGDVIPSKGEFLMNNIKIEFWEITR